MSIVLSILQILGVILLVILGIFLLILALVLFSPLSYYIEGDTREALSIEGKLRWLLSLVGVKLKYEGDLALIEIRVLWVKKYITHDFTKPKEEKPKEKPKEKAKEDKPKKSIKETFRNLKMAWEENLPVIKKAWKDEANREAVAHLKKEVMYFIKILLPKKAKLNADFSTGSPDTTGELCGVLSCFPIIYEEGWSLRPDFLAEEPYFKGDFSGKGRIFLAQIVGILLRVVFDKKCRRMYAMIQHIKKRIERNLSGQSNKNIKKSK